MLQALEYASSPMANPTIMIKTVVHDLRTPLTSIYSIACILLSDARMCEEDRILIDLIKRSSQGSLHMVDEMLTINSDTASFSKEEVDIEQLLHECVRLSSYQASEKMQQIMLQSNPMVATINREKIMRVINNLIGNAIKFSPVGGNISVKLEQEDSHLRITVADQGIGIPEELKDKIFDMLSVAKRKGTSGEQPFGLGLFISRQIVEAHNGKISFTSLPGNGTTFNIELPIAS